MTETEELDSLVTKWLAGLDGQGSIPGWDRNFYLCLRIQSGWWAHLTVYSVGIMDSILEGKMDGTWNWPLTSVKRPLGRPWRR